MLELKIKKILLNNKFSNGWPSNMTQLAAAVKVSDRHLRHLIKQGRPQDIDRIAKGLGVEPTQLN